MIWRLQLIPIAISTNRLEKINFDLTLTSSYILYEISQG